MNETLNITTRLNYLRRRILASLFDPKDRKNLREASLNHDRNRISKAMASGFKIIPVLFLYACGSQTSSVGSTSGGPQASTGSKPTAITSPVSCAGTYLARTWRVSPSYTDTVVIRSDCYFESFACDSVGYIASNPTAELGIVDVVILWTAGGSNCLSEGNHRCEYDARRAFYQELDFRCQ